MTDTRTLHGLDDVLAKLKALPPEIVSKRGGPVLQALRKGAKVVQNEWKANIRNVVTNPAAAGYASTKTLEKSVVVVRSKNPQGKGANEAVTVLITRGKKGVYPDRDGLKAIATGRYLEFGTEHQKAEPWATPGYMSSREKALSTVVDELGKGIEKAIAKVSKGAR